MLQHGGRRLLQLLAHVDSAISSPMASPDMACRPANTCNGPPAVPLGEKLTDGWADWKQAYDFSICLLQSGR